MKNANRKGFTLIELLIVIAIIGILAAVLIPNLLTARSRAFDTAAQSCLKEISTAEEIIATNDPFGYSGRLAALPTSCTDNGILVASLAAAADANNAAGTFTYAAQHPQGAGWYQISAGTGVTRQGDDVADAAALATALGGTAY